MKTAISLAIVWSCLAFVAGCPDSPPPAADAAPLPACDQVCPHQKWCTYGEGWTCGPPGDDAIACSDPKPCPVDE